MNIIKAYVIINLKMLLKDKLPLIWSILFPSLFIILNNNQINGVLDLRFYWTYIIVNSYIFGVGIHALTQREYGLLKTYFSIKNSRFEFFISNIFTQIIFIEACLLVVNIFCYCLMGIPFLNMFFLSNILMIMLLPIAFFSCTLTLFKKIHCHSLSSFCTILITICLFVMPYNVPLNPLLYAANVINIKTGTEIFVYLLVSIGFVTIGLISVYQYSPISNEVR